MKAPPSDYPVHRERVGRYFYLAQIGFIVLIGIWFFGIGLVVAIIYAFTLGRWLTGKQSEALRYWLDGTTLRLDQGVFFVKRKAIPLDRVTDVMLVQGPLMRWCGIWALYIQTAGMSGQAVAEGVLYGIDDPERVRDELLRARDKAASLNRA
jgi:uncharacterized membrane protein YdbT with pleckstrin-like domain